MGGLYLSPGSGTTAGGTLSHVSKEARRHRMSTNTREPSWILRGHWCINLPVMLLGPLGTEERAVSDA